jgi:hypothetical protein
MVFKENQKRIKLKKAKTLTDLLTAASKLSKEETDEEFKDSSLKTASPSSKVFAWFNASIFLPPKPCKFALPKGFKKSLALKALFLNAPLGKNEVGEVNLYGEELTNEGYTWKNCIVWG